MQAIAAATFEGSPVEVDFGPGSGPALVGGGGGIGSWSAMIYIHKMENVLSSNRSLLRLFFAFALHPTAISCAANPQIYGQKFPFPISAGLHHHRDDHRPRGHRDHDVLSVSGLHHHFAACKSDEGHEQSAPDRYGDAGVHERQQRRFPWVSHSKLDVTARTKSKVPLILAHPRITF